MPGKDGRPSSAGSQRPHVRGGQESFRRESFAGTFHATFFIVVHRQVAKYTDSTTAPED